MNHIIFLIPILIISSFLNAQVEEGRRITKELCSEKYFGRGYVKNGDSLAAEFLASEFEHRNLKKVKKSWFQSYEFDVNTFPGAMKLTMDEKVLSPGIDFMVDPSSSSVQQSYRYKMLDIENLFDRNKIVQIIKDSQSNPNWNSVVIDLKNLSGDSLKEAKSILYSFVQYCHVIAITNEKFTFSVSDEQFKFSLIHLKGNAFVRTALIQANVEAKIKSNHQARNVMAMLPAKRRTKKTLIVSAHYDHLGGMGSETFFPGGNDNASGTSMLFTLADELAIDKLKYNVLFIAFSGEEAGLLGSKYFVENPPIKLKHIKFVQNLDIMGSGEEGITVVNSTVYPEIFQKMKVVNQQENLLSQIKERGKAANSDHYWFSEKGIPSFFIYTMGPNKNYHDVFDTYENLSFNEYNDLVKLVSLFVRTF